MALKPHIKKISNLLKNTKTIFKQAFRLAPRHLSGSLFLALIIAGLPFAQSGTSALLVNNLVEGAQTHVLSTKILLLAILSALFYFLPDLIYSLKSFSDKIIWVKLHTYFKLLFFHKKSELDIQTHENPQFQDLINKAEDRGIHMVPNLLEYSLMNIPNIIGVVVATVILIIIDWRMCLVAILASVPNFIIQLKYNREVWGIWDADTPTRRLYNHFKDSFNIKSYLIELKMFQNVKRFLNNIKEILVNFDDKQIISENKKIKLTILANICSGGLIGLIIIMIIYKVVNGQIEVGTMLFIIASIDRLQASFGGFFMNMSRQFENNLYVENIFEVLKTPLALPRIKNAFVLDGEAPEIKFENVSFAYPEGKRLVLKNVSLTIHPGEKFALVGENGAGKTTFVKLLCRVYDPTDGRILIDGKDLREIDLDSWYKTLGVLFQDFAYYRFKVKDSIALGRSEEKPTTERIVDSAKKSESDGFISDWPQKYDQQLGTEFEGGIDPSKGQLQRLAVARLMYRKAGIMILDEPTASVDAEAEKKIFEAIEQSSANQTVILISHKFSTVRGADRICVFKDHSVHEMGTHNELIARGDTYAKLFKAQAKAYKN